MIAAIVLSVLLIMSVTAGATLAWFASRDTASTSLTMGEAVVVTIGEDYKQGQGALAMNLPVSEGGLLPGMSVTPNIKVQLQQSNTNALLRARFITTVEYPDNYEDAAFADEAKYVGVTGSTEKGFSGRVLDELEITGYEYNADGNLKLDANGKPIPLRSSAYAYNVFAGYISYDYYDAQGRLLDAAGAVIGTVTEDKFEGNVCVPGSHTKSMWLKRVEVRDEIVAKITESGTWTINGVAIAVTEKNAAELEIRQRGVDLTNAINRVLAGQKGYGIDPATGLPTMEGDSGIKYTRRVADGWAYRDADQCWYYLGSQTNGFVLASTADGNAEEVSTTQIANDLAYYTKEQAGNIEIMEPHYELLGSANNVADYKTTVDARGTDKARNYLGGSDTDDSMNIVANETAVLSQKTMASIDLSQGKVSIDFLTKRFVLPTFINNNYAKAKVTFNFTVEAVQDYLVDPLQEATSAADRLPNNLVNAIIVFNNAFPQAFTNQTANRALSATGAVTNVVPAGGIPSSVKWAPVTEGTIAPGTTLNYNGLATGVKPADEAEGALYSYGFLKDATITASGIKGFDVRLDDYADVVADYTKATTYVRGTASSLGIAPFIDGQKGTAPTA